MILYAKYGEADKAVDILYIPDSPQIDIESQQNAFFKCLFDKSNNHEYWKIIDGEKTYCEYDAEAFVKWLNEEVYVNISEKAQVVEKNTFTKILDSTVLLF
jgi:hypothetical protein